MRLQCHDRVISKFPGGKRQGGGGGATLTYLNEPDEDNDGCHDGLGGGLSPAASGNRIGIVRATDANLGVLGCIFEEAVKDIDAGDDAEDQVGGQHCPVDGDKFTTPCDCAEQAVQRNQRNQRNQYQKGWKDMG
jgi:hypothetical protein